MPSGSRPVHPQAVRRDPSKHPGRYPGRPAGTKPGGARVKPEVAALLLAQGPASHSLAAACGLGEHRSRRQVG